jgi:hypothetical protein
MEGTGDDKVWNRMLTVWVDESREQDEKVLIRELGNATLPPVIRMNTGYRSKILIQESFTS